MYLRNTPKILSVLVGNSNREVMQIDRNPPNFAGQIVHCDIVTFITFFAGIIIVYIKLKDKQGWLIKLSCVGKAIPPKKHLTLIQCRKGGCLKKFAAVQNLYGTLRERKLIQRSAYIRVNPRPISKIIVVNEKIHLGETHVHQRYTH